jgi:hypothetical protein
MLLHRLRMDRTAAADVAVERDLVDFLDQPRLAADSTALRPSSRLCTDARGGAARMGLRASRHRRSACAIVGASGASASTRGSACLICAGFDFGCGFYCCCCDRESVISTSTVIWSVAAVSARPRAAE